MSESTVFVVRIWRGAGSFRATARAVESDETAVFSEPAELLRFLVTGALSAGAATPGARPRDLSRVTRTPTSSR